MKTSLYISRHLRFTDDENQSRSPGTVIAIAGIAISVVVMILTLSIVTGFKQQIKSKVIGFESEVTIHAAQHPTDVSTQLPLISLNQELAKIITSTNYFSTLELSFNQPAILKTDNDFEGIVVRGVQNANTFKFVADNIAAGSANEFFDEDSNIILSRHTANKLSLDVNDKISAAFIVDGNVKLRRLSVKAIYDTHFSDYDKTYAFVPISTLQHISRVDSLTATQIDLHLCSSLPNSSPNIEDASEQLRQQMIYAAYSGSLPGVYRLSNVNQTGAMYFNWLALLDTNVVVILIIMAIVSGFTLISSLFIIILQRVRTIGLLKVLGLSTASIRQIFIYLGWRIVGCGLAIGDIFAIGILLLQSRFHLLPLDPEAYYLNYVPVSLNVWPIIAINIGIFLLAWALLLIPARMVASISPAATIRYE